MQCQKCGTECGDSNRFCIKCGALLEQPKAEPAAKTDAAPAAGAAAVQTTAKPVAQPVQPVTQPVQPVAQPVQPAVQPVQPAAKPGGASGAADKLKALPVNKIIKIAGAAVAAILLIFIISSLMSGPKFPEMKNAIKVFSLEDEVVISANNGKLVSLDGDLYDYSTSLDGSKAAVLVDYDYNKGGTLWYITSSGNKTEVADDVLSYQISVSGNGIAYMTDYDDDEDVAALYLYNCSSKKSKQVTDEASLNGELPICLSPDGKSVAYIGDYDYDTFNGYISINGKEPERFGNKTMCLAIADGGKYIYYAKMTDDYSGALYVRKGNNDEKLINDLSSSRGYFFLNKDYSQAVFDFEDASYITRNGKSKEKISKNTIYNFILPAKSMTYDIGGEVKVIGVDSFAKTVTTQSDGSVYYINGKFEASKVISSYYGYPSLASDGKTLIYIDSSDRLCRINAAKTDAEKDTLASDVERFVMTADGKSVFYIDRDELWCVKGTGKPSKISDDVSSQSIALSSNTVFFIADYSSSSGGTLYYSKNGGKRTKVASADEVYAVTANATSVFYFADQSGGTYSLFRGTGNGKFTKFQDDVYMSY